MAIRRGIDRTLQLYCPHRGQRQIHESPTRFNIVCFGRQSGKTTFGINKIIDKAWTGRRDGIYWYILQTYDAARVAFNRLMKFYHCAPGAFAKKPNESSLTAILRHGPTISFKSGKNYQDLRVETLDGVIIDEYRQQPKDLWKMVIYPMLVKKNGWADILSTPNGFEHFYDMFQVALSDPEWSTFKAPSSIAPWWTEEEINRARQNMSEAEFDQEIMAEFRDLIAGKAYVSHGEWNKRDKSPFTSEGLISPHLPIIVGLDFNVGLMCWELAQTNHEDWYFFDEIAIKNTHTQEAVKILIDKVKGHKAGIVLVGDATGSARKTAAAGETDYTIIKQALTAANVQWTNRTPDSNPGVKDRINSMNAKLKDANGSTHLWYHPENCKRLGKDLDRVVWKEGANGAILDQQKDTELTHSSDAAGYPVYALSRMFNPSPGISRMIRRG